MRDRQESFYYYDQEKYPKLGEIHSSQWDRPRVPNPYGTLRSQNSRKVLEIHSTRIYWPNFKTSNRPPKRTLSTLSSSTRMSKTSALRRQRREISDNMALLMAKTNTNLILSWIALILCWPFGVPALILAFSVRVTTFLYIWCN